MQNLSWSQRKHSMLFLCPNPFLQFVRQILLFQGYDSKDIFFEIKGRGEGQKIIMEKSKIESEVLNDTTIKSVFKPGKVAGIFDVRWVIVKIVFFIYCNYIHWQMQNQHQIRGQGLGQIHGLGRGERRCRDCAKRRLRPEDPCGMWVENSLKRDFSLYDVDIYIVLSKICTTHST